MYKNSALLLSIALLEDSIRVFLMCHSIRWKLFSRKERTAPFYELWNSRYTDPTMQVDHFLLRKDQAEINFMWVKKDDIEKMIRLRKDQPGAILNGSLYTNGP